MRFGQLLAELLQTLTIDRCTPLTRVIPMRQRVLLLDDEASADVGGRSLGRSHATQSFPLLAITLGLFAFFDLTSDGAWYRELWFSVRLMSGAVWQITGGDFFLGLSLLLLFVELVRATRSSGESIINHALSAVVFIASMLLFITRPGFGNSTFFLFTAMTMLDFMAGFIITTMAARRDTTFDM